MVLRLYQTLKSFLMAQDDREHWEDNFPLVLLGIPATFKPDVDYCPAELAYGETLHLPGEFVYSRVAEPFLFFSDVLHR